MPVSYTAIQLGGPYNGHVFTEQGLPVNGRYKYHSPDPIYEAEIYWDSGKWKWSSIPHPPFIWEYEITSSAATPPLTGWAKNPTYGTDPVPSLAAPYAAPTAPKITSIGDDTVAYTLHNILPWDATWNSSHRLGIVNVTFSGSHHYLNSTDSTFDLGPSDANTELTYQFVIEDSGGIAGPPTKIVTCPRIGIDVWDVVAPTFPAGGHSYKLQTNHFEAAFHDDEWADLETGIVSGQRIRIAEMIPAKSLVRWHCTFAPGYGGQGGSDEFSTSEAFLWPGKRMVFDA